MQTHPVHSQATFSSAFCTSHSARCLGGAVCVCTALGCCCLALAAARTVAGTPSDSASLSQVHSLTFADIRCIAASVVLPKIVCLCLSVCVCVCVYLDTFAPIREIVVTLSRITCVHEYNKSTLYQHWISCSAGMDTLQVRFHEDGRVTCA